MSNFLDELNRNAKTDSEIVQENLARNYQQKLDDEKLQKQKQKAFEEYLLRCLPEIKQVCLSAVKNACYITYEHKRYLICTLQLKHRFVYDPDFFGSKHDCWIEFSCYKLTKQHLLESKRRYLTESKRFGFDYIKNTSKLENIGCERIPNGDGTHYSAPPFVDLKRFAKENIEGYRDVSTIPQKILDINYPPNKRNLGVSFTVNLCEARFLIEF